MKRAVTSRAILLLALGVIGTSSPAATRRIDSRSKSDDWFRSAEGRRITTNVLSWQSPEGSWPKNGDSFSQPYEGDRAKLKGTFDNSATTDELRFLGRAFKATDDARCREACVRGIDHILKAQYPTGGWPQYSPPPKTSYHRHITFNDDAMVRLMDFLREAATSPGWDFIDAPRRESASTAFDRGIGCILKCQVKVNGKLTAWCAQHDEITLEPRPARTFELASLSGAESVGIVRLLMSLPHPSNEVVQAIDAAVGWFRESKIPGIKVVAQQAPDTPKGTDKTVVQDPAAPPMWARFYEIGSNKPIFSGRDGVKKYRLAEIEYERRNGYAWLGYWPQALLESDYPRWQRKRNGE